MNSIGIFTTVTDPIRRGDCWKESIKCYSEFADKVVVVNGGNEDLGVLPSNVNVIKSNWPQSFSWNLIGKKFQLGYEALDTSWAFHADLDFIFHERDIAGIRHACERYNDAPALSFWKYQFILPDRYNLKSRLVLAVNKGKYGDRIKFNSGGDLCQPSLDGEYIKPEDVPEARIPFYNYEKLLKTKAQVAEDCGRMDRAYHRRFNKWLYSTDGTDAFDGWLHMVKGRYQKPQKELSLDKHPKYVQETIKNLKPENFGYNGWGLLDA